MNKNRNPPSKKNRICMKITTEILKDMLGVYAVSYHYKNKSWYIFPRENSKKWIKLNEDIFDFITLLERKKEDETI